MKTDLDRNIVTIRYNILNLADTIQFKNGNQIFNRYAADGRKLSTIYVTRKLALANPIDTSAVYKWVYDRNQMSVTGTTYIGNVEYATTQTSATSRSHNLLRVHNEEGYADNINSLYVSTNYYYLRRDHLGNTREVWRAPYTIFVANNILNPASVVQRTQYYASGLPWAVGEGASTQPYKYNGKEFVEMHGYDTYDYGARGYYAAIMRFSTIDPMAENGFSLSPYNYVNNNPIRYIDPDGNWFWESEEIKNARKAAKKTGGEFHRWRNNGTKYFSITYRGVTKSENGEVIVRRVLFSKEGNKDWKLKNGIPYYADNSRGGESGLPSEEKEEGVDMSEFSPSPNNIGNIFDLLKMIGIKGKQEESSPKITPDKDIVKNNTGVVNNDSIILKVTKWKQMFRPELSKQGINGETIEKKIHRKDSSRTVDYYNNTVHPN